MGEVMEPDDCRAECITMATGMSGESGSPYQQSQAGRTQAHRDGR